MKKIKIGLIGLGWVSLNRHIPAIVANDKFELVGLADRNAERVSECQAKFPKLEVCRANTIRELSWLDNVDAIDVVTAPMSHFLLANEALLLGKHVITEKPFCLTVSDGENLVKTAIQQKKKLCIVHNFQHARSAKKLDKALAQGDLGTIRSIHANQWGNPDRRLPIWYDELPLGLFYDESPHLLYLLNKYAPGELKLLDAQSFASSTGLNTPASVSASYSCSNGLSDIPVTLNCNFESSISEWYLTVVGSKSTAIIDIFRDIYISLPNDGNHSTARVLKTSIKATAAHWLGYLQNGPAHLMGNLLYGNDTIFADFAKTIAHDLSVPNDSLNALKILKMQHEIIEAAAKFRARHWP